MLLVRHSLEAEKDAFRMARGGDGFTLVQNPLFLKKIRELIAVDLMKEV